MARKCTNCVCIGCECTNCNCTKKQAKIKLVKKQLKRIFWGLYIDWVTLSFVQWNLHKLDAKWKRKFRLKNKTFTLFKTNFFQFKEFLGLNEMFGLWSFHCTYFEIILSSEFLDNLLTICMETICSARCFQIFMHCFSTFFVTRNS